MGYEKLYENKEWLEDKFVNQKLSARSIGNMLNVSYKLINLWLVKHDIIRLSKDLPLP